MSKDASIELAKALEEKRWQMRKSPKEFISFLGISRTTWFALQRGALEPGPAVRFKILRRFPDLAALALDGTEEAKQVAV